MIRLIKALLPYLKENQARVIFAVILIFPLTAIKGYQAYLVKPLIDKGLSQNSSFDEALWLAGVLFFLGLLNYPCRFFHFYMMRFVVDKATCSIRSELFEKFQKLPLSFFNAKKHGSLISHAMNDTTVLAQGFRGMLDLIREPLTAMAYFSLMLWHDVQLTFVVVLILPLFVIIFRKSGKKVKNYIHHVQEAVGLMTHNISEGLAGQKITKAFNLQNYTISRFGNSQNQHLWKKMRTL